MRRFIVVTILLIVGVIGAVYLVTKSKTNPVSQRQEVVSESAPETDSLLFANPRKSAHWESNTPEHGSTLAGVPVNVVVNFNFDLAQNSSISITKDGLEFGGRELIIDSNKLSMRKSVDKSAPDGIYTVSYSACWPDGSCHDGSFQFAIDRTKLQGFIDMRGQKEVKVTLSEITFKPQHIRVSRGTKVVWVNNDSVEHYVNTDSHPAHTYYPQQNSKALETGDSYSLIFDESGLYPYHCSAHEASMKASILVE